MYDIGNPPARAGRGENPPLPGVEEEGGHISGNVSLTSGHCAEPGSKGNGEKEGFEVYEHRWKHWNIA